MNKQLQTAALLIAALPAVAQTQVDTPEVFRLDVAARVDWQLAHPDGHTDNSNTGFKGKYIAIRLDGQITDGLTYSWRQRLNKKHNDNSFFDATDWVYLNYAIDGWNFQAGKEVVAIGGVEYNIAPIDLFGISVFTANIPCYDLGVSVGYDLTKKDVLTFQAVQSPFFTPENRNMYGYNLMWQGSHGFFDAIYSANLLEYAKGKYISYIALGNKFKMDRFTLDIDYYNRAASHQAFLFKDCTVAAELSYEPGERWRISGKYTYDVNHTGTDADMVVFDGTELSMAGGCVEFYPLKKDRTSLRLHADCYYSWGKNGNAADVMQKNTLFLSAGVTWDMNILSIKHK